MKRFDLSPEIRAILDATEDGGELTDDVLKNIVTLSGDVPNAVRTLTLWMSESRQEAGDLGEKAAIIARAARVRERRVERLNRELLALMTESDVEFIDVGEFWLEIRLAPERAEIDPAVCTVDNVPAQFLSLKKFFDPYSFHRAKAAGQPLPQGVTFVRQKYLKVVPN